MVDVTGDDIVIAITVIGALAGLVLFIDLYLDFH